MQQLAILFGVITFAGLLYIQGRVCLLEGAKRERERLARLPKAKLELEMLETYVAMNQRSYEENH